MFLNSTNVDKHKFFQEYCKFIPNLPETEKTLIRCFMSSMNQKETAKLIGVTQGAVSSRMRRAQERLTFMKEMSQFDLSTLDHDITEILDKYTIKLIHRTAQKSLQKKDLILEVIKGMIETTSQTETARRLNSVFNLTGHDQMNQIKVKHRYETVLNLLGRIKDQNPRYEEYYRLLSLVKHNLYKLHEVRLPRFER